MSTNEIFNQMLSVKYSCAIHETVYVKYNKVN